MNETVNILIVDDKRENLLALEAVLHSPHHQVISASSGSEALKWVLKKDFAVILLDVQMPGLDGFETARLIHERANSQHIPIIFVTAISQESVYVKQGYSIGAIDYIVKPFPPELLRSKVERFVDIFLNRLQIEQQNHLLAERTRQLEQAYQELQNTRAVSQLILDSALDTMVTMDHRGTILSANPAAFTMFGYAEEQVLLRPISLLIPGLCDVRLASIPRRRLMEFEGRRHDGKTFPVDLQVCEVGVGQQGLLVCSIRDISERKEQYRLLEHLVEERSKALRESNEQLHTEIAEKERVMRLIEDREQQYRSLFEYHPDAIFVRRRDSEIVSFVNETGVALLGGTSKDDVIGHSLYEFVYPQDDNIVRSHQVKVLRQKSADTYQVRLVRRSGEVIEADVKVIPFQYRGEPALHIVVRDVTELKQSREYIQLSQQRRVVGELATGIAHEIRNPLTSLRGFVQLMNKDCPSRSAYSDIMIREIDRINVIVSELLLLGRANKKAFQAFHVEETLQSVITLMRAEATLHDVDIRYQTAPQALSSILGEEGKLKQVMVNILKNAIEAMPDGGEVKVGLEQMDNVLSIHFVDQGCGIPEDVLKQIDKPFFSTKANGTGLGLAICRNIVEDHHGKLVIDSVEGAGTTVKVLLPIALNV